MYVIIGIVVVVGSVLGGYVMHGGPLLVLYQISEFIIIIGTAVGSLLISSPPSLIGTVVKRFTGLFGSDPYGKQQYLNLLMTLYALSNEARREGLISLEAHVEEPAKSAIFSRNPFLANHHHALPFFCDTLRLLMAGGVPPHELEALLDTDIESHHREGASVSGMVQKIGDALPGIGIVAAVLGIIITMQAIDGPPQEVGTKVAAALVGTFLGIILSYGFVQPFATNMELSDQSEGAYFECIKVGVLSIAKGYSPQIAVEFARRVIPSKARPSFRELEEATKAAKAQAQAT